MDCKKIRQMFSDYIDEMLEDKKQETFKGHIASCERCRKDLAEYQVSWKMLDAGEPIEPSPDYVSQFWTELSRKPSGYKVILDWIRNILLPRRMVYKFVLVSATLIAVYISVFNYVDNSKMRTLLINMSDEELEMIENFDLIANLDLFENVNDFGSSNNLEI